jgi:hypothetical protein
MQQRSMATFVVAAFSLVALAPGAAHAQYRFTRIVDGSGPIGLNGSPAAINDAGQVTFGGDSQSGPGIFVGSGGPVSTVADTSNGFRFFGFSSIDGQGKVSFFGIRNDGSSGIFSGPGGVTTFLDDTGPISGFGGDSHSSVSGAFTTVHAFRRDGGQSIFAGKGGPPLTLIADTSGPFSGFDVDPRVNASGQVAFQGFLRSGGSGIFVGNGGALAPIADISGGFAEFEGAPSINDRGEVAFAGELTSGESGIFVSSDGQIRTLVDSSGPFADLLLFSRPTLNAKGEVAFLGFLDNFQSGLFVGPDPVADRVILVGDPLDGSTVAGISVFGDHFNNVGQLAFTVVLADGRTLIVRADPVPEPGAYALCLSLGTVGYLSSRRRRAVLRARSLR